MPFSADIVLAIIEGRKRVTRRLVKNPPEIDDYRLVWWRGQRYFPAHFEESARSDCPHGIAGDRIWVREAWRALSIYDHLPPRDIPQHSVISYVADGPQRQTFGRYRHARFMPRWASRILLNIETVRIQHLHDITQWDASREGVIQLPATGRWVHCLGAQHAGLASHDAREAFYHLWGSIHGYESWDANPWVWAIHFRVGAIIGCSAPPLPDGCHLAKLASSAIPVQNSSTAGTVSGHRNGPPAG